MIKRMIAILAVSLMGCAAHAVSLTSPVATQPIPTPVVAAQSPVVLEQHVELDPTREVFKDDVWELSVPKDAGWRRIPTDEAALVLMNQRTHTLVLFTRVEFVDTLDVFAKKQMAELKSQGGFTSLSQSAMINNRKAILLEETIGDARILQWVFATGAEGMSFACGGPEKNFETNRGLCKDIAAHLYIGKLPN